MDVYYMVDNVTSICWMFIQIRHTMHCNDFAIPHGWTDSCPSKRTSLWRNRNPFNFRGTMGTQALDGTIFMKQFYSSTTAINNWKNLIIDVQLYMLQLNNNCGLVVVQLLCSVKRTYIVSNTSTPEQQLGSTNTSAILGGFNPFQNYACQFVQSSGVKIFTT